MATKVTTRVLADNAVTDAKIADVTLTTATQSASDNTTKVATTAYVTTAIANLADSAPSTLNTLNELAAALGDDANFSTTVTNSIATKLPLAGGTLTGDTSITKSGNPVFMVKTTGAGNNPVLRLQADTNKWDLQGTFSNTNDELFFMYNSSTKMAINKNGNVGIGQTDPATTLHIGDGASHYVRIENAGSGDISSGYQIYRGSSVGMSLYDNPADNTTSLLCAGSLNINCGGSGADLHVNTNGKIGIGTTSPSGPLEIVDSSSGYDQIKIGHQNGTNENKQGGITTTNYEGNSVSYFQSFNQSGNNGLYIGSADGAHRGWQSIYFYVAENSNTTSGFTKAMQINGNNTVTTGFVGIGSGAVGTNQLQVRSGAANYAAAVFESFTGSGATNYGPFVHLINGPNDGTRYLQRWSSGNAIRAQITSSGHYQSSVNSYGSTSDIKLKENIVDATPKLDEVMQLKVKNFNYKADEDKQKLIGMIAQDVEEVFPGLVFESEDTETVDGEVKHLGTTTKSLKYSVFVPVLIKAMQEQQTIIEDLKSRIETLEG
jgi:hypothetical protein